MTAVFQNLPPSKIDIIAGNDITEKLHINKVQIRLHRDWMQGEQPSSWGISRGYSTPKQAEAFMEGMSWMLDRGPSPREITWIKEIDGMIQAI